jgi:2-oxoglutarate ferredoxin oxidoreductase subunit beta
MNTSDIIKPENKVYGKSRLLLDKEMHYCPGCSHGTIHKIIAETIDELNIQEQVIGISPVGCAVLAYDYIDIDWQEAAHGRAPALATAIKRLYPNKYVFTYQGDGDLASIGTSEIIHTCNRGDNITVIFVNNAIYGMTGGQMAPTTLEGMKTATTPEGRSHITSGFPIKITEMLALLPGVVYATRQSVDTPVAERKAKRAMIKAFKSQTLKKGTSFIEFVATCNSGWKMTPTDANVWMRENMFPVYPIGDIKELTIDN